MYYVYVAGYILLAAAMQLFTGNFPVSFLAFPLNIIFAAIWLFLLWIPVSYTHLTLPTKLEV